MAELHAAVRGEFRADAECSGYLSTAFGSQSDSMGM
jgi:hypothetical protein